MSESSTQKGGIFVNHYKIVLNRNYILLEQVLKLLNEIVCE